MNIPMERDKKPLPNNARGNPVYEQTRQDMPLFCCGTNCSRNSRIFVTVLTLLGIICSIWCIISAKYFSFVALRNDTFFDADKKQPEPFEFATEANVGLFRYVILDVYEYPWPPIRERQLFDHQLMEEIRRLQADGVEVNITEFPTTSPTRLPSVAPTKSPAPTTPNPTMVNPNDIVEDTVDIGVTKRYPNGMNQFDSTFRNAQRGSIWAPVFAAISLFFGLIELLCCTYRCSWLPTTIFLFLAFTFQTFTLFLFLSEDFCKYAQDCKLGPGGWMSILAILCYMFAQSLVCCAPRPKPIFEKKKPPPVRRRKKVKKKSSSQRRRRDEEDDDDDDYDHDSRSEYT